MDPKKAKSIFLQAVEQYAPIQWPAYLDEACGEDTDLRHGVELLLAAHQENVDLAELGRAAWNERCPPSTNLPWNSLAPSLVLTDYCKSSVRVAWVWFTWPNKTNRSNAAWP